MLAQFTAVQNNLLQVINCEASADDLSYDQLFFIEMLRLVESRAAGSDYPISLSTAREVRFRCLFVSLSRYMDPSI